MSVAKKTGFLLGLAALAVAYGMAGSSELDDILVERDYYCDRVANGYWPDYRGILNTECNESQGD